MTKDGLDQADAAARLFAALTPWLAGLDQESLRPFIEPLERAVRLRHPEPGGLPILVWLDSLTETASVSTTPLVAELVETAFDLKWSQTYAAGDLGSRFLQRYGWTELVGQRGPFHSDEVAAGFMMLGPDIEYPSHRHVAEEIYVVLSGAASWSRDGVSNTQRPGTLIHHKSLIWHGVATSQDPLLTLYLWRGGDLTQKSEIQAARTPA